LAEGQAGMIRNGFGGVKVMKFDEYYKKIGLRNIKENELLDTLNSSASCIFLQAVFSLRKQSGHFF